MESKIFCINPFTIIITYCDSGIFIWICALIPNVSLSIKGLS